MNINENKMKKIKSFTDKHGKGLIIGGCAITALAVEWYFYSRVYSSGYTRGRIDQYNISGQGFSKQFNEALKVVDDETKIAFIDAFNNAASNNFNN